MRICGFNKTTLLDYPGKVASTIFLGGCNFRCPFCQNGILVVAPREQPDYSQEELLKANSREFQEAHEKGDIVTEGAIGNALQQQARESVFESMIYV